MILLGYYTPIHKTRVGRRGTGARDKAFLRV